MIITLTIIILIKYRSAKKENRNATLLQVLKQKWKYTLVVYAKVLFIAGISFAGFMAHAFSW